MRWLILTSLWLLALPAIGQPQDLTVYSAEIELGVSEFQSENFTEARAHFARAHALYPNARTMRGLGMVAFELKHYAESSRYLEQALASNERPLDAEKRAQTEKLLERAKGYLGRFNLALEAGTRLSVDGVASELGAGSELVLEAGDHALEFSAPGRISLKRAVTVQGGEHDTLRIALAPLKGPESAPADRPAGRPVYKNPWLWTAVGVVVAGAAAGTAIVFARRSTTQTEEPYAGTGGAPALGTPR